MSKDQYYVISEALKLIIKLLTEDKNTVPLDCTVEFKKNKRNVHKLSNRTIRRYKR